MRMVDAYLAAVRTHRNLDLVNGLKDKVYDILVGSATELCYEAAFSYIPDKATVLDVGIGSGLMIRKYHSIIRAKDLRITGIDIDHQSLENCGRRIREYRLEGHIKLYRDSINTFRPPGRKPFDFVFFSMSFMLLKDQASVLQRVKNWMPPHGETLFFQTMYRQKSHIMDFIKPRLKYVTGIEFGPALYEDDFYEVLNETDFSIKENRLIQKKWFKGDYRLYAAVNHH